MLAVDPALLHIDSIDRVILEFTTRCNLRCTYCAVTRPWHKTRDFDLTGFDSLVQEMKSLRVKSVQISGAGETTTVKDWDIYLQKLLDAGFQVTIISNLARQLPPRAIRSLSLCSEITNSCDTVKPELYEGIRKGGDFRALVYNILRIRAQAVMEGRPAPRFIWNAVASDRNVMLFEEWVSFGIALGVDHFQISELSHFEDEQEGINVRPIGMMSLPQLAEARMVVDRARALAESNGKWFTVLPAVEDSLNGKRRVVRHIVELETGPAGEVVFKGGRTALEEIDPNGAVREIVQAPPSPVVPGKTTKNCLYPWTEAMVWATNDTVPCCMYKKMAPVPSGTLTQILNSEAFVSLRERLLTGNLTHTCNRCPMVNEVPVEELHRRVAERMGVLVA